MKKITILFISLMMLTACQASKITTGALDVKDAWARPALSGDNGAVYFVIENGTAQDHVLLSARTDIASAVELHLSQMDGDHMSMHQQEEILLPAGEAVEFSPGGLHVMLVGLTRKLTVSETFEITLGFKQAGEKIVTVTVRDDVNDD
jgi:periplasmic copper chaperone A